MKFEVPPEKGLGPEELKEFEEVLNKPEAPAKKYEEAESERGFGEEDIQALEKSLGGESFELMTKKELLENVGLESTEDLKEVLREIEENLKNAVEGSEEYNALIDQKTYFEEISRQLIEK